MRRTSELFSVRGEEPDLDELTERLTLLRAHLLDSEARFPAELRAAAQAHGTGARNLIHYLALRGHDLRDLQRGLSELGLSSLGRCEAHVLHSIEQLLRILQGLGARRKVKLSARGAGIARGRELLMRHTEALLGPPPSDRAVRIMVTMPAEAARDGALVDELLASGMDCMRINCAHDGPVEWETMIGHLRAAQRRRGRPCKVLMDLAGPKLRTGPIAPGPSVVEWHPHRDEKGQVVAPARIWLHAPGGPLPAGADAALPIEPPEILSRLRKGDRLAFADLRGKHRMLHVTSGQAKGGAWADCHASAWVGPGTAIRSVGHSSAARAKVADFPGRARRLLLKPGDSLVLTASASAGAPARADQPAHIPCTLPEVLGQLSAGERIYLDDGKIGGVIRAADRRHARIEITSTRPRGQWLGSDKGINLPDSTLRVPALTKQDRACLPFVAAHADIVGLSFVHDPQDVQALQHALEKEGGGHLGVVLKIETRRGFEQLPRILLTALRMPRVGVMIARGDLAVECGFERLAEVQEEILWVSEAAHLPSIWATQVLETLARKGIPSRAEITDAAMGERAECVMLNKGPHIVEAVRMLDGILRRMAAHMIKKTPTLRRLRSMTIA